MRTVQEIASAIEKLSNSDLTRLSIWFDQHLAESWDSRLETDANAGKFSFFKTQISQAKATGELLDFP
jgi:hypothetical protein